MKKVNVLDHGFVRLIEHKGSDLSIVRNARVSYDAAWRAGEDKGSDARLLRYLYNNKHNTPFECVDFTFEVKAPIFVLRQWMRHRTWSYNELSARYRTLPQEYYVPDTCKITTQSKDNKQMRTTLHHPMADQFAECFEVHARHCFNVYNQIISDGCPRELARTVLPLSTYSHMFASVDLHNLFGFMRERLHEHAQYEIRVYARAMLDLIRDVVPVCTEIFEESLYKGDGYE